METVHVVYHRDGDSWWADSPEVAGWTATAETLNELSALVEKGVRFALGRDDVLIEHVLGYELPAHAEVVFDFIGDRTVVAPASVDLEAGRRLGRRWHAAPA
jgi:predicted RNase H-like HicB family nuclease